MRAPIRYANTFTTERFGGNPTPVIALPRWCGDATLLALARESGQAYTAFWVEAGGRFHLRWFNPVGESELCGHGTLAAGAMVMDGRGGDRVDFHTASGVIPTRRDATRITIGLPRAAPWRAEPPPAVVESLGAWPLEAWRTDRWMLVYGTPDEVVDLRPDFPALGRADPGEVIVTAPAPPGSGADFVCRCFEPALGVDEDPVTGSAQCTLGPYWAGRLGRTRLRSRQVSARGGDITCDVGPEVVTIGGEVVTYLEGTIDIDDR